MSPVAQPLFLLACCLVLAGIGSGLRRKKTDLRMNPRDGMEVYRSRENIGVLVPDQQSHPHFYVQKWISNGKVTRPQTFDSSPEQEYEPIEEMNDNRRSMGNETKIIKVSQWNMTESQNSTARRVIKVRPRKNRPKLLIKPRIANVEDAQRWLDSEHPSRRVADDDVPYNATLSKFFARSGGGVAAVDVAAEDDSLELLEADLKRKPGFNGFGPSPLPSDFERCGFTPVRHAQFPGSHFRVFGGRKAKSESWPWMSALGYSRDSSTQIEFHCGGTLVSASHVISAAHCVLIPNLTLKAVRFGVTLLTDKSTALDVLVKRVVAHPKFKQALGIHDIALITLEEPVTFTSSIHPICLPYGKMRVATFEETFPFVTGWGKTELRETSPWLKEVRLPVVPNTACKDVYHSLPPDRAIPITSGQMCCGFKEGGRDACQGDSGGPLMLPSGSHPRGEIYYLIGVVSLGEGCAEAGIPGVFTRITSYMDWLSEQMGGLPPVTLDEAQ